jgi:hypothetical protein
MATPQDALQPGSSGDISHLFDAPAAAPDVDGQRLKVAGARRSLASARVHLRRAKASGAAPEEVDGLSATVAAASAEHRRHRDALEGLIFAPAPSPATPASPHGAFDSLTEGRWSIGDAPKVKDWYKQTFGRDLPVTAEGQSATHNAMGLDHSDSLDAGVHPASEEGKALRDYLRAQGIPFLAYDRAVPGAATAPHIHIGFPSHGGEAGEAARAGSITDLFDSGPDPLASLFDAPAADAPDDFGEPVTINSSVDRAGGLPLSFADGGKAPEPVATEPPASPSALLNLQTQEGRAVRDETRADARKAGSFVPVAVALSRDEETDPGKLTAGDAVRRGVQTWGKVQGIPSEFVEKWIGENAPTGYSLHVHAPGGAVASTLIDSGAPYDEARHAYTVKLDAQHLSKLKDDYDSSRGTLQRASDFVSSDEESPGEKVLDVAAPVAGAVGKVGGYVACPFTATSAGVFAGLRGENPFREAFHTFTTGEHTDKGSNPLGNFLRDNRTLVAINPRLGRLLGGAADTVFDPANLIGLGIVGKGARALAGAGRLGRVAEEVGVMGKSLGLLERGIVDARPLGLGEAVADVSSTAAKGGEAAALEGAAQSATREGSRYSVASPGGATHEGTIEALSEKDVARLTAAGSDPASFVRLRTPEGGYVVAERGALSLPFDVEMKTADGARLLHSTATGETRNAATGEAVPLDEGPSPAVRAEMARYSRERADFHAREAKTASNPAARANAQGLADEYAAEAARLEAGDGATPEGSASGIAPRSTVQPRSLLRRAARTAVDLVQLPKTKAGFDLSATGRQALPQILAHPSYFKQAWWSR